MPNAAIIGNRIQQDYYMRHMPANVKAQYDAMQQSRQQMAMNTETTKQLAAQGLAEQYIVGPGGQIIQKPGYEEERGRKAAEEAGLVQPRETVAGATKPGAAAPAAKGEEKVWSHKWISGQGIVKNPEYNDYAERQQYAKYGNPEFRKLPTPEMKRVLQEYEKAQSDAAAGEDYIKNIKPGEISPDDSAHKAEIGKARQAVARKRFLEKKYGVNIYGVSDEQWTQQPSTEAGDKTLQATKRRGGLSAEKPADLTKEDLEPLPTVTPATAPVPAPTPAALEPVPKGRLLTQDEKRRRWYGGA